MSATQLQVRSRGIEKGPLQQIHVQFFRPQIDLQWRKVKLYISRTNYNHGIWWRMVSRMVQRFQIKYWFDVQFLKDLKDGHAKPQNNIGQFKMVWQKMPQCDAQKRFLVPNPIIMVVYSSVKHRLQTHKQIHSRPKVNLAGSTIQSEARRKLSDTFRHRPCVGCLKKRIGNNMFW